MEIVFVEDGNGIDTVHISATDGSGTFVVDTVVVAVMAVNDAPTTFSLLSPADSAEVIITTASVAQNATIDVSWNASEDADGDTIGYGFVLFNGSYSIQTEALYVVDVEFTELSIPHSAAVALLEVAGYQSLTCDWLVFATDGQDTTASSGLRTLTIDARPVLSVDEAAIPEVFEKLPAASSVVIATFTSLPRKYAIFIFSFSVRDTLSNNYMVTVVYKGFPQTCNMALLISQ